MGRTHLVTSDQNKKCRLKCRGLDKTVAINHWHVIIMQVMTINTAFLVVNKYCRKCHIFIFYQCHAVPPCTQQQHQRSTMHLHAQISLRTCNMGVLLRS